MDKKKDKKRKSGAGEKKEIKMERSLLIQGYRALRAYRSKMRWKGEGAKRKEKKTAGQ
jgi:hypothetical protein